MKRITLSILIAGLLMACEEDKLMPANDNQFVVEAFLYAGEPIRDIRIKTTFPLSDIERDSEPINDAEVSLMKGGESYSLVSIDSGYYAYPGTDLEVLENDVFSLEVNYRGRQATATTVVPPPTEGLQLSVDTIFLPVINIDPNSPPRPGANRQLIERLQNSFVVATWDNATQDLYFMTIESTTEMLDPIFPEQLANRLGRFRFVSEPTTTNEIIFAGVSLETFGTHLLRVYRINQEYADLYENQTQDSRDLNEPPSNVRNALGVFSAFNSAEVVFEVSRE